MTKKNASMTKRISIFLLVMILGLLPGVSITAHAEGNPSDYIIYFEYTNSDGDVNSYRMDAGASESLWTIGIYTSSFTFDLNYFDVEVQCSHPELFSVSKDSGEWRFTSLSAQPFTGGWMKITVAGVGEYDISVSCREREVWGAVEFSYGGNSYPLPIRGSVKLDTILDYLNLSGEVTAVQTSHPSLFSADLVNDEWVVTSRSTQDFSDGWMKVTIGGSVYEIAVNIQREVESNDYTYQDSQYYGYIADIPPVNGGTVYFGGDPWRVIGMDDSAWLLILAKNTLDLMKFSEAQSACGTVYEDFAGQEKAAVLSTEKKEERDWYWRYNGSEGMEHFTFPPSPLSPDTKLFLLSVDEHKTYMRGSYDDQFGQAYWLRSLRKLPGGIPMIGGSVAIAYITAWNSLDSSNNTLDKYAARPAFQLDLTKILFTSPAEGAKSTATAGSGTFGTLNDPAGNAKLTLLDSNRPAVTASIGDAGSAAVLPGGSLSVSYSGVTSGDALSALICDENGKALYYASTSPDASGSGTWDMTLPDDLSFGKSYTLRLFSEKLNSDFHTDYAGAPCDLTLTIPDPYPLWIGDTQVNPGNKDNILGAIDPATNEPTASYDPATKTLTLHTPTISGAHADYKIYSEDSLTIEGEATITGDKGIAVVSEKEELNTLTIQNAALDISADWEAIYARNTHVVMNSGTVNAASALHRAVNVQVHGSFTMNGGELVIDSDKEGLMVWRGNQQAYVDGENNIVINGGRIDAKSVTNTPIKAHGVVTLPAAYYAHLYGGDTPLSLEHVELNDNYGIYYNSCFVDESGERITGDRLVIEPKPIAKYDLWVGDTQVDEANKDDIPGVTGENAKASFDPATNTLTLENVTGVTGNTMGALITAEGIDLTVEGSAVLANETVAMGIQVAPGSLTMNGDFTISAESYGIYVQKDVTVAGGTVVAEGEGIGIYSARGALNVNGGRVEASGSMCALYPNPNLSGNTGEYEVLVNENYYTAAAGASPWSGDDVNDPLGGFSSAYKYVKIIHIPTLVLLDDDSEADTKNHELIRANLGEQVGKVNVRIEGRTLYKTGHWNTLMLPFSLATFAGTPLEDADVRELVPDECAYANGTLMLKFAAASSIEANKPYIVRWAASDEHIVNPLFANVFLEDGIRVIDLFEGGILFFGTYDSFAVPELDKKHYLYMGGDSKLYYPLEPMNINAFRAFFYLRDYVAGEPSATGSAKGIGEFVLNFGDGTTSLTAVESGQLTVDSYYSIDGRRLQGEPTKKGIYIKNGKKVIK